MEIKILAFGITHELIGEREFTLNIDSETDVAKLRNLLYQEYPNLKGLKSMAIACNEEYAEDHHKILPNSVIALIPPVSGG